MIKADEAARAICALILYIFWMWLFIALIAVYIELLKGPKLPPPLQQTVPTEQIEQEFGSSTLDI